MEITAEKSDELARKGLTCYTIENPKYGRHKNKIYGKIGSAKSATNYHGLLKRGFKIKTFLMVEIDPVTGEPIYEDK